MDEDELTELEAMVLAALLCGDERLSELEAIIGQAWAGEESNVLSGSFARLAHEHS